MPAWLQSFIQWSPFTYELFFPVQVYQERVQGAALLQGLAIQAGWMLAMWAAANLMWKRGLGHYQAVGG
jgi:ABC-2 type transport system permease protein